jgi:PAS domain S-box-containing protein
MPRFSTVLQGLRNGRFAARPAVRVGAGVNALARGGTSYSAAMKLGSASWPLRYALVPALAVALLTLVLLLVAQWLLVDELARRTLLRSQHRAGALAQQLDAELHGAVRELQLLARGLRPDASVPALRAELEFLRQRSPKFVWLGFVSPDGKVLAGTQGWLEGRSIASRPVFSQGLRGSFVGDAHPAVALADLMATQGQLPQELLDIGEPVRDAQGRVVAVLAAHLGVAWVDELRRMASGEAQGAPVPALTVHVLSGAAGRSLLAGAPPTGSPLQLDRPALVSDLSGNRYFAATAELGSPGAPALLPWRVLVLQQRDAALGPAWRVMRSMAVLGIVAALVVALAGVWASRRLLQPWGPLFRTVLAGTPGSGEPRQLAEDVSAVVGEIERYRAGHALSGPEALLLRLARDASDLRRIVDHLPMSVVLIDAGYRVEYLNPAYTRLLGWTTEQVRGRIAAEFLFDAVERAEFVRQFDLLADPPGEFGARFYALTPSGERVAVQWRFVPMLDAQGRMAGAIALLHDIRPELAARARADALAGRMRALADAALDELLSTLDDDARVLEWSRGAEHLTGLTTAAALGRPIAELLGLGAPIDASLVEARRSGRCAVAWECLLADGRRCRFEGSVYPLGLAPGTARFGLILRDLSEQHAVHQALERSEAHMRLAVDAARIGTWEIDLQGTTQSLTWSAGYADTFGVRLEQLPQTTEELYALVHPDDHSAVRAAFLASVRDDAPLRIEFRLRGEAGWHWHEIHGRALRAPDGRALRIGGIGMDTTERNRAEAELRAGRERLEHILQTMAEGLVTLDAEGRYAMVNRATETMVDAPAARIIGRRYDQSSWRRLRPDGQEQPPEEHAFVRLRRGDAPIIGELVGVQAPGRPLRMTSLNAQPIFDAAGRFDGAVLTYVDITERWHAERALADSQARLAAVVDSASDAIISTDLGSRISLFNPAAERIFGLSAAQMLGRPLEQLLPAVRRGAHGAQLLAFAESGVSRRAMGAGRVQGVHAGGRPLELEASISQARVNGETVLTAILRDVTERVQHERALETTRSELALLSRRLLDQEKETTRRLAQALHDDLGQTLSALRLNWDAFQAAPDTLRAQQCERLGALVVTANRQIRNVLGELRPPLLDELGLAAALDNELQQQRPLAAPPRLQLQVPLRLQSLRWPSDVEYAAFMIGREALVNALQHAQADVIDIRLEGDAGELHLEVRDDGVGIALDAREGRIGHLGLVGMRERARAIGAHLQLNTASGRGTAVELRWTLGDEPDLPD